MIPHNVFNFNYMHAISFIQTMLLLCNFHFKQMNKNKNISNGNLIYVDVLLYYVAFAEMHNIIFAVESLRQIYVITKA